MHIFIIIIFILFLYGAFSTVFHSTEMVGQIGKVYGETNINMFGALAYIDLLILTYPLYRIYKNKDLLKDSEFYIGWVLLFISLILFQSLVVENLSASGSIGFVLYSSLYLYIGKAGLWLLWLLSTSIALILVFDEIPDFKGLYNQVLKYSIPLWEQNLAKVKVWIENFKIENPFFDKQSTDKMTTIVTQRFSKKNKLETTLKSKTLRKLYHKTKTVTKRTSLDELTMLEERPIDDIGTMTILHEELKSKTEKNEVKNKPKAKVQKKPLKIKKKKIKKEEVEETEEVLKEQQVADLDELYEQAKEIILTDQKTSISYVQRKLQIGYNRSANIIEQLQEMGILSTPNNKGQREILL